jgi:hypothetical protein
MQLSGSTRPIIFGFILAIGITLTLPYITFAAAHSLGGSATFRAPRMHRQHFFLRPFHPFGFVGVGGVVDEQPVIIIQQFQPAAAAEPNEAVENRIYVQPRWVDGGYGVQDTGLIRSNRKSVDR